MPAARVAAGIGVVLSSALAACGSTVGQDGASGRQAIAPDPGRPDVAGGPSGISASRTGAIAARRPFRLGVDGPAMVLRGGVTVVDARDASGV